MLIQAGAGGVGLAAIQLAKRAGATVLATASSDDRLDAAARRSASTTASTTRSDDWVERVRAADRRPRRRPRRRLGRRRDPRRAASQCLAYRGRCITVGNAGRDPQPLDVSPLAMGNQSLTGVFLGAEIATDAGAAR